MIYFLSVAVVSLKTLRSDENRDGRVSVATFLTISVMTADFPFFSQRRAELLAPSLFSCLALCQLSGVSLVLAALRQTGRPGPTVKGRWDVLGHHCHSTHPQRTAAVTSGAVEFRQGAVDLSERPLIVTRCQTLQNPQRSAGGLDQSNRRDVIRGREHEDAGVSSWTPKRAGQTDLCRPQILSDPSRPQQVFSSVFIHRLHPERRSPRAASQQKNEKMKECSSSPFASC